MKEVVQANSEYTFLLKAARLSTNMTLKYGNLEIRYDFDIATEYVFYKIKRFVPLYGKTLFWTEQKANACFLSHSQIKMTLFRK